MRMKPTRMVSFTKNNWPSSLTLSPGSRSRSPAAGEREADELKPRRREWEAERRSLQREQTAIHHSGEGGWGREPGHLPRRPAKQAPRSRGGGGSARHGTRCKLLGFPRPPLQDGRRRTRFPVPRTATPPANKSAPAPGPARRQRGPGPASQRGPPRPERARDPGDTHSPSRHPGQPLAGPCRIITE